MAIDFAKGGVVDVGDGVFVYVGPDGDSNNGFVLTGEGLPTVYVSGDNASLDAVRETADRFAPIDTALLFAGAPRFPMLFDGRPVVLDSAQAAEATRILDARRVVPVHHDSWAHFTEGRDELEAAFAAAGLTDRLDQDWAQRA